MPPLPLLDGGFENPPLAAGTSTAYPPAMDGHPYQPAGSAWLFGSGFGSANAGLAANGSAITAHNDPAPEGQQVAWLSHTGLCLQHFTLAAPWSGTVTARMAASADPAYSGLPPMLLIASPGIIVWSWVVTNRPGYQLYTSPSFTMPSGPGFLIFQFSFFDTTSLVLLDGIDMAPAVRLTLAPGGGTVRQMIRSGRTERLSIND